MAVDIDMSKCTPIVPGIVQLTSNINTYYIQCYKTGGWFYCIKARLDKLVTKYGSLEKLGKGYLSRDAKQEIRAGNGKKISSGIRKRKNNITDLDPKENTSNINWPSSQKKYLPKSGNFFYTKGDEHWGPILSKDWTRCLRPHGIFTRMGGYCNGCRWYGLCTHPLKDWKKFEEQEHRTKELEQMKSEMGKCIDHLTEREA